MFTAWPFRPKGNIEFQINSIRILPWDPQSGRGKAARKGDPFLRIPHEHVGSAPANRETSITWYGLFWILSFAGIVFDRNTYPLHMAGAAGKDGTMLKNQPCFAGWGILAKSTTCVDDRKPASPTIYQTYYTTIFVGCWYLGSGRLSIICPKGHGPSCPFMEKADPRCSTKCSSRLSHSKSPNTQLLK